MTKRPSVCPDAVASLLPLPARFSFIYTHAHISHKRHTIAPAGPRFPTFEHPTPINVSIRPLANAPQVSRKNDNQRSQGPAAVNTAAMLPLPAPTQTQGQTQYAPNMPAPPPQPVPAGARAAAYAPASEPRPIAAGANPHAAAAGAGSGRGSTLATPSSDTGRCCSVS